MSSSNFASNFAPYTPPPDDPSHSSPGASGSRLPKSKVRPWFPNQEGSQYSTVSYQSGGLPSLGNSHGGGGGIGLADDTEEPQNQWETTYGMRVDFLAAFAYLLGPVSALLCLIIETHNDFVRFHAYQSALLTTPFVLLRIFGSLVHLPTSLNWIITVFLISVQFFMAFRAFVDASQNNLSRFYIPRIGDLSNQWVSEE